MKQLDEFIRKLREDLNNLPQHDCPRCGEVFRGIETPLCWECTQAQLERQRAMARAQKALASIDRRYAHCTFESYECGPGDRAARDLIEAWKPGPVGLYIHGDPGAGKSHLAYALARKLSQSGHPIFVSEWTNLLQRLRSTYDSRRFETARDIHQAIRRADVVIIDDFATGKPTEWAIEQAWSIVHGRYQSERPLVITSNYKLGELRQRIGGIEGARIVSRLAEMTERVEVRAQDYRLRGLL